MKSPKKKSHAPLPPRPPEHPGVVEDGGEINLPLPAYLALLRAIHEERPTRAPYRTAISSARYEGQVTGRCAQISAELEIEVLREGWSDIQLFGASAALRAVTVTEGEATVLVSGDHYRLLAQAPGRYRLRAELVCALLGGGKGSALELELPHAAAGEIRFTIPRTGLEVNVVGALQVETTAEAEQTRVEALLPPGQQLRVEWSDADAEATEVRAVQPLLNAEVVQLVSIGEGLLRCRSEVNYELLQGEVSTFELRLPDDIVVLSVEGQGLRSWRAHPEGDVQRVEAQLHYPISEEATLTLSYQRTLEEDCEQVSVPPLEVEGVERQHGYVGLEARTNVEITVQDLDGVTRIDIRELPSSLWGMAANPLLFGFEYLRGPGSIAVGVTKHQDIEVLVATIDAAFAEATMVADGRLETRITYLVRNNQKQFLRLRLPEQSTVWSAFVSDKPVKPAADGRNPGCVLVSLDKSQSGASGHAAFPVELVYLTEVPAMKHTGALTFVCPQVDIPINHLLVRLHLPEEYRYSRWDGSLKKVDRFSRPFYQPPTRQTTRPRPEPVPAAMMPNAAPMPQQIQQQAFSEVAAMPDIDRAIGGAIGGNIGDQTLALRAVKSRGMPRRTGGVLPVRVMLPGHGTVFCFEKLLVIDEHPDLTARYRKPWWALFKR